jgi:hypothetical protein
MNHQEPSSFSILPNHFSSQKKRNPETIASKETKLNPKRDTWDKNRAPFEWCFHCLPYAMMMGLLWREICAQNFIS